MKKLKLLIGITLFLSLNGVSQKIENNALEILKQSFRKVEKQNEFVYKIIFIDSMLSGSGMRLNETDTVFVKMKDMNTFMLFRNGVCKLITRDTLFTKPIKSNQSVFLTNFDNHSLGKYEIHNILGTDSSFKKKSVDSIYMSKLSTKQIAVIDIVYQKRDYMNGTIKDVKRFDRIWIDRKTLMPMERKMFSSRVNDEGRISTDVYEYIVSFPLNNPVKSIDKNIFYHNLSSVIEPVKNSDKHLQVGSVAPSITFIEVATGIQKNLDDFKGKVVLLDFWYLSCLPCRALMPDLQKLKEQFNELEVIGINITDTSSVEIINYLNRSSLTYKQFYKSPDAKEKFKTNAYPTTFLIDKNGKIIHSETGYSEDFKTLISKMVEKETKTK